MKRFAVVCCEHTDSYDSPVLLSGQFHTQEEAESYVEDCVRKSIEEFPGEKVADDGLVQTFDEDGRPNYGCVWTVVDLGLWGQTPHEVVKNNADGVVLVGLPMVRPSCKSKLYK